MTKKVLALLLALVLALSCAACGGQQEPAEEPKAPEAESDTPETSEEAAPEKEEITITLMDQFIEGEGNTPPFRAGLENFKKNHPEVTLEEETLSTKDLATKTQTLAAADELPDIFMLKGQMAKSFVENGYAMDLSDFLAENEEWVSGFRDGVFSNFEINGGVYGIPFQVTNTFVYYNTQLFEQAGIEEFPETWSGLIEACGKLQEIGVTPIVLGNSNLWPAESVLMSTLGNRCSGDDWYASIRNNDGAKFTDPEFVLSLQSLYDLAASGAFNSDVNSIDEAAMLTAFVNGNAAMMFNGSWGVSLIEDNMDQDMKAFIKYAPMPTVEGGKGRADVITGGAGWAFAVNANLDPAKKEIVEDFMMDVINYNYANMCAENGNIAAYIANDYELDEDAVLVKQYFDFIKDRPFIPVYDHQLSGGLMDVMQSGLQEILNNTKTADVLAEELQAQYEMENG